MPNIAHDLFLLMINLAQLKNRERIITVFSEAINGFHPGFSVEFSEGSHLPEAEAIDICTAKYYFGQFKVNGNAEAVSPEFPNLFHNAVQMLAVILEKLRHDILLADEKLRLKELVDERTEALRKSQEQIRKDLEEKEILLKEIHHRVKNNLNVITSLLKIQASQIKNKEQALTAFRESRDRIYAMALVHERLYQTNDFSRIDMKSYIDDISRQLMHVYGNKERISLDIRVKNVSLDINTAIPCGLILNEIITNAIKYAFADNREGCIKVELMRLKDRTYQLSVSDNGVGLPEGLSIDTVDTLGLELVNILTHQIDGVLDLRQNKGTEFKIVFPHPTKPGTVPRNVEIPS